MSICLPYFEPSKDCPTKCPSQWVLSTSQYIVRSVLLLATSLSLSLCCPFLLKQLRNRQTLPGNQYAKDLTCQKELTQNGRHLSKCQEVSFASGSVETVTSFPQRFWSIPEESIGALAHLAQRHFFWLMERWLNLPNNGGVLAALIRPREVRVSGSGFSSRPDGVPNRLVDCGLLNVDKE